MSRSKDLFEELKIGGLKSVLQWIKEKNVEHLFLDYKQSLGQQKAGDFSSDDQKNLSKAISGFGNTSGGIIIWGVKCKQDKDGVEVPTKATPLKKVNKFKSKVERLISGLSIPPHDGIENEVIEYNEEGDGFLVTHIPRSIHIPIRATKKNHYYMRSGSSFAIIPHDILATMFGMRPEPVIKPMHSQMNAEQNNPSRIDLRTDLRFKNAGNTILKDFYINGRILSRGGNNCEISFAPTNNQLWQRIEGDSNSKSVIATDSMKIAPGVTVAPLQLQIRLMSPITENLHIQIYYGCEGSKLEYLELKRDLKFLRRASHHFLDKISSEDVKSGRFLLYLERTKSVLEEFNQKFFQFEPEIEYVD